MKCKKPNCNGVVEKEVCTKCGATSDRPAAGEEGKKDRESNVKEPAAASPKSAAEAQQKAVGGDKEKTADAKKGAGVPEKHSEKKEGHKEIEHKKGEHKEEQPAKASSEKVEEDAKSATKQSELAKRVEAAKQSESAKRSESESIKQPGLDKREVSEPKPAAKSGSGSGGVTPPPMAGGQSEPKAEAKSEPKSEAKPEPKSEAKPEPKSGAKSETESEAKSETSKKAQPDSAVAARAIEPTTAKKSNTEERKKIESTIQNSLLPEPTEERPSLKDVSLEDTAAYRNIIVTVRSILEPREVAPTREDLYHAARALRHVMPYNFDAWRLHADLLLTAIHQLETRQLQPDPNFTLMAIPLREDDLRDAAEQALRQCAHFADNEQQKIDLIDEANSVRRLTWF